ncbi:hypothetical protein GCM10008015_22970 [Flavobacterium palustre]|uniref:DUF4595 domain-containing protein n=1 Tax=Flavobacterium palustre TaxID=1476463 RepID=A0ABQ1HLZ6_9FLAO|nr:hypothetical protein [Flavobacterium palustre]GGA81602.1 hypothetical protein GCM10008015_22970 [Flavobacterium palustre]
MRKLNRIFFFITIVAVLFSSCSNEKEVKGKNFVKIIESTENGISENSVFTYNQNQLLSSDNSKERIDYTYTDGLITKIVKYNKQNQLSVTLQYTYQEDKLIKVISSDDYVIYYTHQNSETILYEKYKINTQNQEQKVQHGTLFFKNKNLIKIERTFDNVDEGVLSTSKTTYEYDTYNNPYYAILGYSQLLDNASLISKNNVVLTVVETKVVNGGEVITSANLYPTTFKYDADNYPTEQVSESSVSNPNYLKIQYLY